MELQPWMLWVISIAFLLLGLGYVAVAIPALVKKRRQAGWIETQAKIISCEPVALWKDFSKKSAWERVLTVLTLVDAVLQVFGSGVVDAPSLLVKFEYEVLGQRFERQEQVRANPVYKPGAEVPTKVNPASLAEASIETRISTPIIHLSAGIIMFISGIAILILITR